MSRPSAPVFQTLGAAKEEDMAEEDGSEERSAERVEERSYVRDKINCTTLETSLESFIPVRSVTHIICTSFS